MMIHSLQLTLDAHDWYHFTKKVHLGLNDNKLTYRLDKETVQIIYFDEITAIRFQYIMGGKHAPNKFCCKIYTQNKKCITLSVPDRKKNREQIGAYKEFVQALIARLQKQHEPVNMFVGYTKPWYRFLVLMMTSLIALFTAILIYFLSPEGTVTIGFQPYVFYGYLLVIVLLVIRFFYIHKHRPQVLSIFDSIPQHVFPK
jgi:hypothetical protein